MIPAPFTYVRAGSVDEAVAALTSFGDDAKLIAGGHSLLPLMKLRLATPGVLVDLDLLDDLRGVRTDANRDTLSIGALTTHQQLADDPLLAAHCGVLAQVAGTIGDPQVRHRGTIGGALAHGDAAGDLPAAMVALDAVLVSQGPDGRRDLAARDFFRSYLTTALEPDEVLVEVRVPRLDAWRGHHEKFTAATHGWAIVGALALLRFDGDTLAEVRVALTNMGSTPVRCATLEDRLQGMERRDLTPGVLADATADLSTELDPPSDLQATAEYRRHLAGTLTQRALTGCLQPR